VLLPDRSSQEIPGVDLSEEQAQYRPNQSLDWFSRSRCVLAALRVDCNPSDVLALAGV
jgi:hypothetical protein